MAERVKLVEWRVGDACTDEVQLDKAEGSEGEFRRVICYMRVLESIEALLREASTAARMLGRRVQMSLTWSTTVKGTCSASPAIHSSMRYSVPGRPRVRPVRLAHRRRVRRVCRVRLRRCGSAGLGRARVIRGQDSSLIGAGDRVEIAECRRKKRTGGEDLRVDSHHSLRGERRVVSSCQMARVRDRTTLGEHTCKKLRHDVFFSKLVDQN